MSHRGPLLGPLGLFLRESVTIRLPDGLKLCRLGVTITAWAPKCQKSPPMSLDARTARIAIKETLVASVLRDESED